MTEPPPERNHLIDAARVASVLVVVIFHSVLYELHLNQGRLDIVPWAPGVGWWLASWFFMIIPVFFIAGGFAHAVLVTRLPATRAGYTDYLATRGRRLVGPLVLWTGVATLVGTLAAWLGDAPRALELSRQFAQLLWFVAVYLVIVAAAPWLVRAQRRRGALVLVPLAVAMVLVDAWSFRVGQPQLRNLNMLTVWPLCHQLGVGYHDGWFRAGPPWRPWAAICAGAAMIALLVFMFGYPPPAVGFADIPIANVQPPTTAMALLGLAQAGVLGLAQRAGVLARVPAAAQRGLSVAGALLMTVYLWHIPCLVVAGGLLVGLAWLVPGSAGLALAQPSVAVATLVVVGLVVPWIGRVEYRLIPPPSPSPRLGATVTAFAVVTLGTTLVWLNGTVLHPADPWPAIGLAVLGLGVSLMFRGARVRVT